MLGVDIPTWSVIESVLLGTIVLAIFSSHGQIRIPVIPTCLASAFIYLATKASYAGLGSVDVGEPFQTGLFTLIVFLCFQLIREWTRIQESLGELLIDGSFVVQDREEALREIKFRLLYCRRHNRRMGVLVLEPHRRLGSAGASVRLEKVVQRALAKTFNLKIASEVSQLLRRTDTLVEQSDQGYLVVACPETDRPQLDFLKNRIEESLEANFDVSFSSGVSVFPDEALTYEDLVKKAREEFPTASSELDGQRTTVGTGAEGRTGPRLQTDAPID